jgi:hypothetical protein
LERRAMRFWFFTPLRLMRDISAARSAFVMFAHRDFAARFCCASISYPHFGHFIRCG